MLSAGCLGTAGTEPPAPGSVPEAASETEPGPIPLDLVGCDGVELFLPLDPAQVRPHVPEAFDLVMVGPKAMTVLGSFACGPDGATAERAFLAVWVTPRDEALLAEGVQNYFWEPEHLLAPSAMQDAFARLGSNHTEADAVWVAITATGATADADAGAWAHRVEAIPGAVTGGPLAGLFPPFREYAPAEGGYAYFQGGFGSEASAATGTGWATARLGSGSTAAAMLGAEAEGAAVLMQDLDFTDVAVGFVPRPS